MYLRDGNLEALSDCCQHLFVLFLADEGDGQTLGTKTTGTTDTVQVGIGITWHVVIDSQVDTLDVNTTTEDVSSNADALVELLELLITLDTGSLLVYSLQVL